MPAIPAAIRTSFLATLAVLTVVGVARRQRPSPRPSQRQRPSMAAARPASAHVDAAAGELINLTAHKEMWGREQKAQRPIASITKVMTALVVIRAGDLRRRIRISSADVRIRGQP